jgi:hypothetical protein
MDEEVSEIESSHSNTSLKDFSNSQKSLPSSNHNDVPAPNPSKPESVIDLTRADSEGKKKIDKDWDNKTALSYFQSKMMNLADSLKEQMGTIMQNSKGERIQTNKMTDQVLAAAV